MKHMAAKHGDGKYAGLTVPVSLLYAHGHDKHYQLLHPGRECRVIGSE